MEAAQCGNGGRCDQNKVSKPRVVRVHLSIRHSGLSVLLMLPCM